MVAVHEYSTSDDFMKEVFSLYTDLSKDRLYGVNRFTSQKRVLDISRPV
jgi:hypothetical protein